MDRGTDASLSHRTPTRFRRFSVSASRATTSKVVKIKSAFALASGYSSLARARPRAAMLPAFAPARWKPHPRPQSTSPAKAKLVGRCQEDLRIRLALLKVSPADIRFQDIQEGVTGPHKIVAQNPPVATIAATMFTTFRRSAGVAVLPADITASL
ncbi:MAG: hypothetical protein AVDCRST_MAG28-3341 [uncultured Rubrobacteraceae bacterium]|uniref:Uncharacterized protein n=1 Tax=uncultured Rubrobacteraceae bacterium TaxID=349277 RepID=A0A6J4R1I6_9ACTN|nr:MAG: hypothetical protein AVDCRST_MAG28-3341 [uncultured Rubrobacteraceae bacterium]